MRTLIKYIIAFISLLTIFSCKEEENVNYLKFGQNGLCLLSNWHVFGPFNYDTLRQKPEETFYNRDLDNYAFSEDSFKIDDLEELQKMNVKYCFLDKKFTTHNLASFTENISNKGNYYLATIIKSEKEQDLVLLLDGAASLKIWLNQKMIYQMRNRLYIRKIGNKFIPIHLKKGENIVLVKINRESNQHAWGADFALTTQSVAKEVFCANYVSDFVINPIIIDTIKFYSGPLKIEKVELQGEKVNFSSKIEHDDQIISGFGSLPEGFYDFRLITKRDTLTEKIYKGNILEFYKELKEKYLSKGAVNNDGNALIERIDFIIKSAGVFPPITSYGDDKECNVFYSNTNLVFWVERFKSLLNNDNSNLMLKSYQSPIDKNTYQFLIYLHKGLALKPKIPLIVVMPYAINDETFPSSWYLGNLEQILADCKLASERGFAICWLFSRGPKFSLEASFEDFNCSLGQIKKEFNNVDIDQIYLTGDCLGATRALSLSEYFPDRIKVLSLRSPIPRIEYYKEKLKNIAGLPIFIEHGIYDNEIPIEEMRLFITTISKDIKQIQYSEVEEGHYGFRKDYRKDIFDFFKQKSEK